MGDYSLKSFKAESAGDAYRQLTEALKKDGSFIESRGEPTLELLNVAVEIENPRDRIINIEKFNLPFILQETFDILNSNPPRVIHSREMLEKTMGNSEDPMFFGNELRQAFSRWSLYRIYQLFKKDKNTRKAVLDLGNRRPIKHTPCMIFSHFIIRKNKLYMTAETRGTAVSMGFINDIFFLTLVQELLYSWLRDDYPDLQLGSFLYKTVSLHTYVDEDKNPIWNQFVFAREGNSNDVALDLNYNQYLQDMGVLYHYVDTYMKVTALEDLDAGDYTLIDDVMSPERKQFKSVFFYNWANILYKWLKMPGASNSNWLRLHYYNLGKLK